MNLYSRGYISMPACGTCGSYRRVGLLVIVPCIINLGPRSGTIVDMADMTNLGLPFARQGCKHC